MDNQWVYYDFVKNWDEFYKIWVTEPVQTTLQKELERFCDFPDDIYWKKWKKGDPIWELSDGNYWPDRITQLTKEYINTHNLVDTYKKRLEPLESIVFSSEKEWYDAFSEEYFEEISRQFTPKVGTMESLICTRAEQYVSLPLYNVCCSLFPDDLVLHIVDRNYSYGYAVLVPSKGIVFDLYNFFNYTVNKTEECDCTKMLRKKFPYLLTTNMSCRDPLYIIKAFTIFQASNWLFLDSWVLDADVLISMIKNFYYIAPHGYNIVSLSEIHEYNEDTLARIMFDINTRTSMRTELDEIDGINVMHFSFVKGGIHNEEPNMWTVGDDNNFETMS